MFTFGGRYMHCVPHEDTRVPGEMHCASHLSDLLGSTNEPTQDVKCAVKFQLRTEAAEPAASADEVFVFDEPTIPDATIAVSEGDEEMGMDDLDNEEPDASAEQC